jgi:putative phosphoribosyl transferase
MFRDRSDAGRQLARRLTEFANRTDVLVLGLLRGGVPVAFEIAQALCAPLDILLVGKLGVPGQPELAMGAVGEGGIRIVDWDMIQSLNISREELDAAIALKNAELRRREQLYQDVRAATALEGACVIVVDDGIATGASMIAAIAVLRSRKASEIIVAVPVTSSHVKRKVEKAVQGFVCIEIADRFSAVGEFYQNFSQVEDEEVRRLLMRAATSRST